MAAFVPRFLHMLLSFSTFLGLGEWYNHITTLAHNHTSCTWHDDLVKRPIGSCDNVVAIDNYMHVRAVDRCVVVAMVTAAG